MTTLSPQLSTGWAAGFVNLLSKEMGSWWRTKRWLVHVILWPAVINWIPLIIWLESRKERTAAAGITESLEVFVQVGAFFALVGAVLVAQGAVVGERKVGTAAWVLTKPTTRKAFILSKLVAITFSFLALSLVVPTIAILIQFSLTWKLVPDLQHFSEAMGIVAVHQTFYIALALMLGTLFSSRGPVGGIALGFWIAGNILPNMLPKWVPLFLPWPLVQGAAKIAQWNPVPMPIWIPTVATFGWSIIFVLVALWRFEREEF